MSAAHAVLTVIAIAANAFSGIAALLRFGPIRAGMAAAGVPETWMVFPIGVLKTAGAAGLLLGFAGVPVIGTAAAAGLVLFFVCAVYTHLLAGDWSLQLALAAGFLALAAATLATGLPPGCCG